MQFIYKCSPNYRSAQCHASLEKHRHSTRIHHATRHASRYLCTPIQIFSTGRQCHASCLAASGKYRYETFLAHHSHLLCLALRHIQIVTEEGVGAMLSLSREVTPQSFCSSLLPFTERGCSTDHPPYSLLTSPHTDAASIFPSHLLAIPH